MLCLACSEKPRRLCSSHMPVGARRVTAQLLCRRSVQYMVDHQGQYMYNGALSVTVGRRTSAEKHDCTMQLHASGCCLVTCAAPALLHATPQLSAAVVCRGPG